MTPKEVELAVFEWGANQQGLLSIKVANSQRLKTCKIALDVIDNVARREVHRAFCEFEPALLKQVEQRFDIDWMTFTADEYPAHRRAFFLDCEGVESRVPSVGLHVFPPHLQTASPDAVKRWLKLVEITA